MRTATAFVVKLFTVLALAFPISTIWWSCWMDGNCIGSPGIVAEIFKTDGEEYYNSIQYEMTIILFFVIYIIVDIAAKIIAKVHDERG